VAIAATYTLTNLSVPTSSAVLYTVPTTAPNYSRDLILTNAGTTTIYLAFSTAGSQVATTTGSFAIPTGGTVLLTQCQVPTGSTLYGLSPTNAGAVSIGYGSVVSVI
jgi:hypothetical protein